MLITHNLKAAWRNILKHKVQNTISVLCLSVGVIFFAITLYFTNIIWGNFGKQLFQPDRVHCELYKDNKKLVYCPIGTYDGFNEIEKINQLPSVEKLIYISFPFSTKFMLYDYQGNSKSSEMSYRIVSPDWLADNNFRSSITDKKIGTLKPGTIVVNQYWRNKDDLNWVGATVSYLGKKQKISDVVYSPTYLDDDNNWVKFYLVADTNTNYEGFCISNLNCIVKKGHTNEQFVSELNKLYPEYKIKWGPDYKKDKNIMIIVLFCLILLGSSVLIIGMSGYLKMQLQLFLLRTREMALRRCNGAKPYQLFMLLCYELLIVFCFVTVISILLSIAFADYALPLIERAGMTGRLCIYPHVIHESEPYIVIVTLLCAIGIAWLVVRKTLKSPLSKTVGRSFTQRTLWNGTMQVVQYLVTIILFFAIILTFYGISEASRSYKKNVDPDYFKNVLNIPLVLDSTWNEVKDIKQLPSVDKKAAYCIAKATIPIKDDSIMYSGIIYRESDSINFYSWFVAEAEYFPMFRHEITEKPDSGDVCRTTPVFASKEDVDSIKHLLSLNYSTSNEETLLPDGNKYVKIGYTDDNKIWQNSHSGQHFYIIKDVDKYSPHGENVKACVNILQCWMYIIPKNNDQELFSKEYDALMHKYRHAPSDVHYPIATVYDLEFKTHQNVNLITEFLSILTAVSILCIILTVYSSISLETRGKQKEVAIRKVNGAKTRDIVMLFSRYYIITLCTAFALSLLIGVALVIVISITVNLRPEWTSESAIGFYLCYLVSIATITLVTLLTVWQKIYKISHINPALLIKKE